MTWTVFVEGGGTSKDLRTRCREAFHDFLAPLDLAQRRPKIVACGTRADAFKRFRTALESPGSGPCLLLVDSEEPVEAAKSAWEHVAQRSGDGWIRPEAAEDHHLHFMAVCMESWIAADGDSLARLYGQGFRKEKLPKPGRDIESISRAAILKALQAATSETQKGAYSKGKASFAALGAVNVGVVSQRLPFCNRFVDSLTAGDAT